MSRLVYIGLGSNLEHPEYQLETALAELDAIERTQLVSWSSLYCTAPLDVPYPQPDFVNAVALLRTELAPEALLVALRKMEMRHGARAAYRNAPRALDLDLLLMESLTQETAVLTLPHPRMHERAFVLAPLVEIAPDIIVPGRGPARALLEAVAQDTRQRVTRLRGARPIAIEEVKE